MYNLFAFLKAHRNDITAMIFLAAAVVLIFSVRSTSSGMGYLHRLVLDGSVAVQQYILYPLEVYQGGKDRLEEITHLTEENRVMREELALLRPNGIRMEELLRENIRLRQLLNMPMEQNFKKVVARVVGDSSSAFSRAFVVNAGEAMGVRLDLVAVNAEGMVGRMVKVGDNSALILALLDINSRVPVYSQRSRVQGIVTGNNGLIPDLSFVPKGADLALEDQLLTSGIEGIFPPGLLVGSVVSLEPVGDEGLFQKVAVRPAVDFSRIEEIAILIPQAPLGRP